MSEELHFKLKIDQLLWSFIIHLFYLQAPILASQGENLCVHLRSYMDLTCQE